MTQWLNSAESYLKPRDLKQITDTLDNGNIVLLPSDSGYSLLCRLGDKNAAQRIRQIRDLDKDHPFTLVCSDLTHLARYARVDNPQYHLLKTLFPGAYTTILPASKEVPRLVQHEKRKTIGIRVPDHAITKSVIEAHGDALMGISISSDTDTPYLDPHDLDKATLNAIDLIVDIGEHPIRPTTVLDLTEMPPTIIRQGTAPFPL